MKRFMRCAGGTVLFACAFLAASLAFGTRVKTESGNLAAACQSLAGGFFSGGQMPSMAEFPSSVSAEASGLDSSDSETPPVFPQFLESTLGLFVYYNQGDPRWRDSPYGPRDLIRSHGCGPTALAMIVSSCTEQTFTPDEMAVWADENGYCIPSQGSLHSLIPGGCASFGLSVTSMKDRTAQAVLNEIRSGRIVVALLKQGYFTDKGHFLILIKATDDGKVQVADPANQNNNGQDWDPDFILSQLRASASAGGPLWSIGHKIEP